MDSLIKQKLIYLADKYETSDFLKQDPSQFMHRFNLQKDQEVVALMASSLAFGRRDMICKKIESILQQMKGNPCDWIINKGYEQFFSHKEHKFYRFYSEEDMISFFSVLNFVLIKYGSLGCYVKQLYKVGISPLSSIISIFKDCSLIPKDTTSACKRVCMFLRWMVRQNSPVDLGIWDWYDSCNLIIPLDTHVMQEVVNLNIIDKANNSMKSALKITKELKSIWPEDPTKGDFALFGLGVDID